MRGVAIFVLMVILLPGIFAAAGVSPSSYVVNFEPLLAKEFVFDFYFNEKDIAEIYIEGDLGEFLIVDKSEIIGKERVTAKLSLPSNIEVPGTHYLFVGAKQKLKDSKGVGIAANIRGVIKIDVPYPGNYIEPEIYVSNADVGENLTTKIKLNNRGEVDSNATPIIQIFENYNLIRRIELEEVFILKGEELTILTDVETKDFNTGNYTATVVVDYGGDKLSRADNNFRIGEFKVIITNYTQNIETGGLRPFFIDVESLSNNKIEKVYAEANVLGFDFVAFTTPSISLDSFGRGVLEGYLDTTYEFEESVSIEITLYYGDSNDYKLTSLGLLKEGKFLASFIFSFIAIILFAILIRLLIYWVKLRK